MKGSRVSRSIAGAALLAGTLAALGGAIGGRRTPEPRPASMPLPVEAAPAPVSATDVVTSPPVKAPLPSVGPLAEFPSGAARTAAASLLASAVDARARGDLRTTLGLLQTAVEHAPTVETHAALGALYLELGVASAADTHLRAAAEAARAGAEGASGSQTRGKPPAVSGTGSLRQLPKLVVTTIWTPEGLPVGVQLVAAHGREDLLLRVAAQLEAARPWAERKPPISA